MAIRICSNPQARSWMRRKPISLRISQYIVSSRLIVVNMPFEIIKSKTKFLRTVCIGNFYTHILINKNVEGLVKNVSLMVIFPLAMSIL